jgi:hypothetical protein
VTRGAAWRSSWRAGAPRHRAGPGGRIDPVSLGPVTFTVTDADLAAAQGCPGCVVVAPDPGPGVVFDVRRQNPNRLRPRRIARRLDARGRAHARGPRRRDQCRRAHHVPPDGWTEVTGTPTALFDQSQANQARVRVTATYRLRLAGDASAGTFTSPVTYRIRDTTQTASHTAQVNLPTFLALRWVGAPPSGSATLSFDYAATPMAYVQAVTTPAPLAPTSADFDRLEVSTNHPSGYTVTVWATLLDAPPGAPSLVPRLTLAGAPAEGRRFTATGPTDGFVTLATPDDFGLVVDGSETPGAYRIELRTRRCATPDRARRASRREHPESEGRGRDDGVARGPPSRAPPPHRARPRAPGAPRSSAQARLRRARAPRRDRRPRPRPPRRTRPRRSAGPPRRARARRVDASNSGASGSTINWSRRSATSSPDRATTVNGHTPAPAEAGTATRPTHPEPSRRVHALPAHLERDGVRLPGDLDPHQRRRPGRHAVHLGATDRTRRAPPPNVATCAGTGRTRIVTSAGTRAPARARAPPPPPRSRRAAGRRPRSAPPRRQPAQLEATGRVDHDGTAEAVGVDHPHAGGDGSRGVVGDAVAVGPPATGRATRSCGRPGRRRSSSSADRPRPWRGSRRSTGRRSAPWRRRPRPRSARRQLEAVGARVVGDRAEPPDAHDDARPAARRHRSRRGPRAPPNGGRRRPRRATPVPAGRRRTRCSGPASARHRPGSPVP